MSRTCARCTTHFQSVLTFLQSWNPWIIWVGKSLCYHWAQQLTQHLCVLHWTICPSTTFMSFHVPRDESLLSLSSIFQCLKCANSNAWNLNVCEISVSDGSLPWLLHLQGQHCNAEFLWLPAVFLVPPCGAVWTMLPCSL